MRFTVDSPVGPLAVTLDGDVLTGVSFGAAPPAGAPPRGPGARVAGELAAYFAGELTEFTVPVRPPGGSDFERAVWARIAATGYGETVTYGAIAAGLGDPGAARAVGTACHRNPVPVVVPCHRVVGAGNRMVGFGGGLARKRVLLELEARVALQRAWS